MEVGIKQYNWEQYWSGGRCLLFSWYLGNCYTREMEKYIVKKFESTLIISRSGRSVCYFDLADRQAYGQFVCERFAGNEGEIKAFCSLLKERADLLFNFIEDTKSKNTDPKIFNAFISLLYQYVGYHIAPRHIIDFIDKEKIDTVFSYLEKIRLYTEPVYEKVIDYFYRWGQEIAKREQYSTDAILCLTGQEVQNYYAGLGLPKEKELLLRYPQTGLFFTKLSVIFLAESEILDLEQLLIGNMLVSSVAGSCAFSGIATGIVRIVDNPSVVNVFNQGDILVAPMTRPEYLPFMKKAGAIVTDAGGLLCHAAIVARELKIPCVTGTKIASKIFKDGDRVEVDAEKGIIKKLK